MSVAQIFAANTYSQNTRLSVNLKNVATKTVLSQIEDKSQFYFIYDATVVDVEKKISIESENELITNILDKLFEGTNVVFKINDRQIALTTESISSVVQQQKSISGKVTDSSGVPLPGVTVVVKGTTTGVITDMDGKYTLAKVPENAILQFSFVGMKTQEIVMAGKANINVVMREEAVGIEEVVAIGYGVQKKESLTGAVDQVKMQDVIGNRPVSNLATALQGSISGVKITSGSGMPGQSSSIDIRGTMSINGGSPLILVDNVPVGDIKSINPSDIESVSVLKDASSSSIYGGRAAFGVILITTKKGIRNQGVKFNYTCNLTSNWPSELPEKASTIEQNNALLSIGNTQYRSGQDLVTWNKLLSEYQADHSKYSNGNTYVNGVYYQLAETDLYKKCFTNSFEQMHNFSFSGGSEKSDYRVSFGYVDEDGILITNKDTYKKFNVNVNLNSDLTNKLSSELNIFYKNDKSSIPPSSNIYYNIATMIPAVNTGNYYLDDGSFYPTNTPNNVIKNELPNSSFGDELRILERLKYKVMKNFIINGEYTFIKSSDNSITITSDNKYWDIDSFFVKKLNETSKYYRSYANTNLHALNLYASYDAKLGNHELKLLIGTNQELRKSSSFWASRLNLISINVPSLATATGTMTDGESFDDYSISGYFSRLNYNFNNKYLLEANVRYDGSSKFPKESRYGLFPSFSAGWVVTEEPFMKPVKNIINFMKIRGSWGEIGNQDVANYSYIPSMGTYNASWINASANTAYSTVSKPNLVSSSLTWEKVRSKNIGVDLSFLNRRLNTTFDYFNRLTIDMLGPGEELPSVIGASAPQKNVANLVSKGWELSIDWKVVKPNFSYSLGIKLWDDKAYVTKYDNEGGLLSQYYDGYEFGEIWGYKTYGFYTVDDFLSGTLNNKLMNGTLKDGIPAYYKTAVTNPGDIRYEDLNNDGKIDPGSSTLSDPGDKKIIGNNHSRYQFGITGKCEYKNFDLSVFIQGVGKQDVWTTSQAYWPYTSIYDAFNKYELDFWTAENLNGYYPRLYPSAGGNTSNSILPQTKYLLNGAYVRLKNIELGYTIPKQIIPRFSIDGLRMFISVENLVKLDHLPKGINPELSDIGNGVNYPYCKKISFGVNLTF
jgi:TonB-linked SusC/RagA family outer membrane protein